MALWSRVTTCGRLRIDILHNTVTLVYFYHQPIKKTEQYLIENAIYLLSFLYGWWTTPFSLFFSSFRFFAIFLSSRSMSIRISFVLLVNILLIDSSIYASRRSAAEATGNQRGKMGNCTPRGDFVLIAPRALLSIFRTFEAHFPVS